MTFCRTCGAARELTADTLHVAECADIDEAKDAMRAALHEVTAGGDGEAAELLAELRRRGFVLAWVDE